MKIAIFHELPYGGARRAVLEFGRELKKKNKIDLFYIDERQEKNLSGIFSQVTFYKFIPKKWKGKNWKAKLYKDTLELYKLRQLHRKVAKVINSGEYDFVFIHGSKFTQAPFILKFVNSTTIYYCQEPLRMVYEELFDNTRVLSFGKRMYERTNRKIRKIIDHANVKSADILLANSKYTKQNIKMAYNLSSTVCYMGVDIKRFYPENYKKKFDLLFVGSMEDIDGYSLLQDAISQMRKKPDVRYLLREKEWISDDRVLRKIYCESQLLVCLAYKEPFGLLPIEAQACGLPVVAVAQGGYLDTVKNNQTGFLVQRNAGKIAELLTKLLASPRRIKVIGENAYEDVIENWTWERSTKNLLSIYKRYKAK